jgi:hypothetical protein
VTDDAPQTPKPSAGPDAGETSSPATASPLRDPLLSVDVATPDTAPPLPPAGGPTAVQPVVPPAPTPPVVLPEPDTGQPVPVIAEPSAPATTASGLPNPHGLPDIAVDRPEVAIGAAFGGGLVLALILKRLAR